MEFKAFSPSLLDLFFTDFWFCLSSEKIIYLICLLLSI